MFDKYLSSFQSIIRNTGFQRLMDSSAPEDSAESNNDAHNGNEYTQKKQRTNASEVTNPWLMGIFCSKDMFVRVWGFLSFLCTPAKLPVWLTMCMIQYLPVFTQCFKQKFGTSHVFLSRGVVGKELTPSNLTHFQKWYIFYLTIQNVHVRNIVSSFLVKFDSFRSFQQHTAEIDVNPASWFELGVSNASAFEVLLVSLALVYYASVMPSGKSDLINYCKGIVNDSPHCQGHDQRWSPPDTWR